MEDKVTGKQVEQVDIVYRAAPQSCPSHPARSRWLTGSLGEHGLWHHVLVQSALGFARPERSVEGWASTAKNEVTLVSASIGRTDSVQAEAMLERARLVRLCARLTGNVDAAEDLAQETLLEA
jgi:hypothetical protein